MSATVKGLWTKKELAEARCFVEACEANGAYWGFADWLLAKEPMGPHGGHPTGSLARLEALALELGDTAFNTLRNIRATAYAWPSEHRVVGASFAAHSNYRRGGPAKAADRAVVLASRPRDRLGKIRSRTNDMGASRTSVSIGRETHALVVAEASAAGCLISVIAEELLREALGARAWLAAEEAA